MRVVIADDHDAIRKGVRARLAADFTDLTLDEAKNGQEAVDFAIANRPGLVILDINIPILDGLDAASEIQQRVSGVPILFFTMHTGQAFLSEARRVACRDLSRKIEQEKPSLRQRKRFFKTKRTSRPSPLTGQRNEGALVFAQARRGLNGGNESRRGRREMQTWRELYSAAVLETDANRLDQRIEETTNAMTRRAQELEGISESDAERQEMARASEALLVLKSDQQAWSDGKA
jgi:CheY-like chemotaxis protein